MSKKLKKLIKLSKYKSKIDKKRGNKKYFNHKWLLNEIISEVKEVKKEIKKSNIAYLEDELGDILWGWIILVEKLRQKGYIKSHNNILKRVLKKYSQRIYALNGDDKDNSIWEKIKKIQKKELKKELKKGKS